VLASERRAVMEKGLALAGSFPSIFILVQGINKNVEQR